MSSSPQLTSVFSQAHRELRPRTPVPRIEAEFFPFAGLNHTARLNNGTLRVRISDILADAPIEVVGSLAAILLARLYRKTAAHSLHHIYRSYILGSEIQARAHAARAARGRKPRATSAQGRHVDLEASYDRISQRYLTAQISRPRLSWSAKRSRCVLGRYDALHGVIFISRIFDSPNVPEYVLDYILFHELLHLKHEAHVRDARCIVHTAEFRNEERKFAHYKPAKQWLKSL